MTPINFSCFNIHYTIKVVITNYPIQIYFITIILNTHFYCKVLFFSKNFVILDFNYAATSIFDFQQRTDKNMSPKFDSLFR